MAENLLKPLRAEIDRIDRDILDLIERRVSAARRIGDIKAERNLAVVDIARENTILRALQQRSSGLATDDALAAIFTEIISACREVQRATRVAYLGPPATFTHRAAIDRFGKAADFAPEDSIHSVFRQVECGHADFGVVPVENSSEGSVNATLDELTETSLRICGEVLLPISHCLAARTPELGSIRTVLSHPQALAQCRSWLRERLPGVELRGVSSTAAAAQEAALREDCAAVGAGMCADLYGLHIVVRDIQDRSLNLTRFLIVGVESCEATARDKTSIVFSTAHRPGALHRALAAFAQREINLLKIESRPSKTAPWEYVFFTDFEGHETDDRVRPALENLRDAVQRLKILGSYPVGLSARRAARSDAEPGDRRPCESVRTNEDPAAPDYLKPHAVGGAQGES